MVIKSTIPVGYTASVRAEISAVTILFSVRSFCESPRRCMIICIRARIIVGTDVENARLVEGGSYICRAVAGRRDQGEISTH